MAEWIVRWPLKLETWGQLPVGTKKIYALHPLSLEALVTIFPQIVSSLEKFPPSNSFRTIVKKLFKFSLHKRNLNAETI